MDKSSSIIVWRSRKYKVGVEIFLKFASNNANNLEYIHCPSHKYGNINFEKIEEVRTHLYLILLIKDIPIGFCMEKLSIMHQLLVKMKKNREIMNGSMHLKL